MLVVFGPTGVFQRCFFRILSKGRLSTQSHVRTNLNAANEAGQGRTNRKVNQSLVNVKRGAAL